MKKLNVLVSVIAMSFLVGCGGGSSGSSDSYVPSVPSAADLLVGKTFYHLDTCDAEFNAYFEDFFDEDTVTDKWYINNEIVDETIIPYQPTGTKIVYNHLTSGDEMTCEISGSINGPSVSFDCTNFGKFTMWKTLQDAKNHPNECHVVSSVLSNSKLGDIVKLKDNDETY